MTLREIDVRASCISAANTTLLGSSLPDQDTVFRRIKREVAYISPEITFRPRTIRIVLDLLRNRFRPRGSIKSRNNETNHASRAANVRAIIRADLPRVHNVSLHTGVRPAKAQQKYPYRTAVTRGVGLSLVPFLRAGGEKVAHYHNAKCVRGRSTYEHDTMAVGGCVTLYCNIHAS